MVSSRQHLEMNKERTNNFRGGVTENQDLWQDGTSLLVRLRLAKDVETELAGLSGAPCVKADL